MSQSKYVLRVRVQNVGGRPLASLWLLRQWGNTGRSGRLHGDMHPNAAEEVIALFEAAGVPIEREERTPGTDALVCFPHGTVEATIAATAAQGVLFEGDSCG